MIPLPEDSYSDVVVPKLRVPVGHWKDGICDCFTYGPCHNHFLMACFCPLGKFSMRVDYSHEHSTGLTLTQYEPQLQQGKLLLV